MPPDVSHLLWAAGGVIFGLSIMGALTYHLVGKARIEASEAWHGFATESFLRAEDRRERAGELDQRPPFTPPPLRTPPRRPAPGFIHQSIKLQRER